LKEGLFLITSAAKKQILATINSPNLPKGYFLRIGLKGSACSATFIIGLDKVTEFDEIHLVDGLEIVVDKRHLMYLLGIKIDHESTEEGVGFTLQKSA
jgi:iron-sulfur cluster assembly protein